MAKSLKLGNYEPEQYWDDDYLGIIIFHSFTYFIN